MFADIYVPFDGSAHAQGALELALELAARQGTPLVGSHVYAARLHERRFRALESGLPAPYRQERRLEQQREIHDSLITNGLELITDAYLRRMAARCAEVRVPFRGVTLEGRNWEALVADIEAQRYGLVVMGAVGHGRTEAALVGTVCERVVRRVSADVLVVRSLEPAAPTAPIVACLDGSALAWGGLELGLHLAALTGRPLMAVAAFDPFFHYTLFDALKQALGQEGRQVFKFEQQERLHERIIDAGLAKIYQSHLDVAARWGRERGQPLATHLLKGRSSQEILRFAQAARPWLLIVGRTGIHGGEALDLGGVTERVLRMAPCNLLIAHRTARPPADYLAEATIAWSEEGRAQLERAPAPFRGFATAAIERFALEQGHTVVTSAVVDRALAQLLGAGAGPATDGGPAGAPERQRRPKRLDLSFRCPTCRHVEPQRRPERCPACGERGSLFAVVPGGHRAEEQPAPPAADGEIGLLP
ncbi:MAG: universal stress protein [Candidatus Lambdaproteobacteria bacterium]|nr:universal stress protein [Candidatus Lambdaproteobacteria bacterium]